MTSQRQKYCFYHFCFGSVCLDILENLFMYARQLPVQTKAYFKKKLQFLTVAYDMGVLGCAVDVV